jgi:hypothetical protein
MAEAGGYIDVVLPSYRTDPEENDRFYPSVAKAIADKVLETELRFVLSITLYITLYYSLYYSLYYLYITSILLSLLK